MASGAPRRVYHWKHGWVPLDAYAMAKSSRLRVETVRATVANHKALNAELTSQGVSDEHPMRGVLTRRRGSHFVVARNASGRIVGGIAFDKSQGDVGIEEVRVMDDQQSGGVGHRMIAEAAKSVAPKGSMTVYGAVDSAKHFYAKTGASFRPGSSLGSWSDEAVAAMKAGKKPPEGANPTWREFRIQEAADYLRQYPESYRERYGSKTPEQVGIENARRIDGGDTGSPVIAR